MSDLSRKKEASVWGWYIGAPLISVFLLYLPWLLIVAEAVIFETDVVFQVIYAIGLFDVLEPLYDHTIDEIFD